jgi:hypothetical protein
MQKLPIVILLRRADLQLSRSSILKGEGFCISLQTWLAGSRHSLFQARTMAPPAGPGFSNSNSQPVSSGAPGRHWNANDDTNVPPGCR